MKILSIAVPCYNSAGYMKKCIDSLIVGGDDVEILIINDGSSDDTAVIADSYETRYPNIAKAIHQETWGMVEPLTQDWLMPQGCFSR